METPGPATPCPGIWNSATQPDGLLHRDVDALPVVTGECENVGFRQSAKELAIVALDGELPRSGARTAFGPLCPAEAADDDATDGLRQRCLESCQLGATPTRDSASQRCGAVRCEGPGRVHRDIDGRRRRCDG